MASSRYPAEALDVVQEGAQNSSAVGDVVGVITQEVLVKRFVDRTGSHGQLSVPRGGA